jgi:hypothetical protein
MLGSLLALKMEVIYFSELHGFTNLHGRVIQSKKCLLQEAAKMIEELAYYLCHLQKITNLRIRTGRRKIRTRRRRYGERR